MSTGKAEGKLAKNLKLVDVYAISTGAMFSSGFFLLPGLAFALSGSWVIVAYLASAVLVVPSMLSKAELASAMPKAGGTYYFLDRSLGPMVGTIGGLGTWVAMGLKNTFALIGMGAYLGIVLDVDIQWVALALTVVFTVFNIAGAKETAGLQRILVFALVSILGVFVAVGLWKILSGNAGSVTEKLEGSFDAGVGSVFTTIGLVFVSYAGLTKTVSVAEEVENPDRNIIRGMVYSLLTAATIYCLGSFVLVMVLDHASLASDLTPIASAAQELGSWVPTRVALIVILIAAVAAFASTANAGIMAASRYLLAMGRDKLVPDRFGKLGRLGTPTLGVLASSGFIAVAVMTLDVLTVAKLASAFQLLMFALVNLSVIVMRESKLHGYDPAFRSPLYPWVQILGIFASLALIVELGHFPMLFSLFLVALCVAWFFLYAKKRVVRRGAILHWFERLGRERFGDLEIEMRELLEERGLRAGDPYDEVVANAPLLDLEPGSSFETVVEAAAAEFAERIALDADAISLEFLRGTQSGATLVDHGVAIPHFRAIDLERPQLVCVRVKGGVSIDIGENHVCGERNVSAHAFFFLVSPEHDPQQHLRLLAKLASLVRSRQEFEETWKNGSMSTLRASLRRQKPLPTKPTDATQGL